LSLLAWLADKELERAVAAGVFDQFDGKGKPLPPSQWADPHEGDWEIAFRIMRQAEVAPRWIELDKDIRQRTHSFRRWLLEQPTAPALDGYYLNRLRERAAAEIQAINRDIELRNQLAPAAVKPRFMLRLEEELKSARQNAKNQQAGHGGRLDP
jgi:hypothetical protein